MDSRISAVLRGYVKRLDGDHRCGDGWRTAMARSQGSQVGWSLVNDRALSWVQPVGHC